MRLESYNAAPFEFEPLHADADAAAQDTLPPETPADSGMPPPVADEAPGELLRKLALHPPAHAAPLHRGRSYDDLPSFEDAPALRRREARHGYQPDGFERDGGDDGDRRGPPLPPPADSAVAVPPPAVEALPPLPAAPPEPAPWAAEPAVLTWNDTPGSRGWVAAPAEPAWTEEPALPAWVPEPAPSPVAVPVPVPELSLIHI